MPALITGHPEIVNIDTLWGLTRDTEAYTPREHFRVVAREYKEASAYLPIIDRMGDEEIIPRRFYQPTTSKRRMPYTWVMKVRGTDPEIGIGVEQTFAVQSTESMTLGEIRDEAERMIVEEDSPTYLLDFIIEMEATMHRVGTAW